MSHQKKDVYVTLTWCAHGGVDQDDKFWSCNTIKEYMYM